MVRSVREKERESQGEVGRKNKEPRMEKLGLGVGWG